MNFLIIAALFVVQSNETIQPLETCMQLVATMSDDLQADGIFPFGAEERNKWHYIPSTFEMNTSQGLYLHRLNPKQSELTDRLLSTVLSAEGRKRVTSIRRSESVISPYMVTSAGFNPDQYSPTFYKLSIFGNPRSGGQWGFRYQGHHLSLNFSFSGNQLVSMTPAFWGAWPAIDRQKDGFKQLLPDEENIARSLAKSFTPAQIRQAFFDETSDVGNIPRRILFGPGFPLKPLESRGISFSELNDIQQLNIRLLIESYLKSFLPGVSATLRQRIFANELRDLYFTWAGSLEPQQPHYYRIQSDAFVIEYWNTGNHIHTVMHQF